MKTLLLVLLLASSAAAKGPKWSYSDPKLNDEMTNIYHDIGAVLGGTAQIRQFQSYSTVSDSTTASSVYVPTNLTKSITPRNANSQILIVAVGDTYNTGANSNSLTIYRDSTNLGDATYGMTYLLMAANVDQNTALVYVDTPASTDELTYTVYMRTSGNTMHYGWQLPKTILLFEISN